MGDKTIIIKYQGRGGSVGASRLSFALRAHHHGIALPPRLNLIELGFRVREI